MKTPRVVLMSGSSAVIAIGASGAARADRGDDDGGGKVAISTTLAPAAIGPYSQAIRVGKTVYVSGEVGIDPATGQLAGITIGEQTDQALKNVAAILAAAELTLDNVVATNVYLLDVNDFAGMNAAYGTHFKHPAPARATIQVAALPKKGAPQRCPLRYHRQLSVARKVIVRCNLEGYACIRRLSI